MNNFSVILTITLILFLLIAPRRYFFFPFILAACFLPMNQRVDFLGLDFTTLRLLIFVGFLRVIMRGETRGVQWNKFDKLFLCWVVVESLVYVIQQATFGAAVTRSGVIFDIVGIYWLTRQILCSWADVYQVVKIFAIFALVTFPLIAMEKIQESSWFSLFGPVAGVYHRGRFRAAGPFPHFIIMGCFWASLLPLFYARIKAREQVAFFWFAIFAALSNVYCSASSTPIFTVAAIIFFWKFYKYRMHGKLIFQATCFGLFLLHLTMNAPVWHLISRIDIFGGSTGWHRYFLFNNFVNNISEWFLIGTKTTAHWGHAQQDLTNQFVLTGVRGGMISLVIFIVLIYYAIKIPGKFSLGNAEPAVKWMSWGVCVAILGHFVTFWGVSYFGQIHILLSLTFALVGFTLEQSALNQGAVSCERSPNLGANVPSPSPSAASQHISS